MSRRVLRLLATLVVTGLCTAYLLWKIDVSRTLHILAHASLWYFLAAVVIMVVSVWPMAWRWRLLADARRPGGAGARDLVRRKGGRRRFLAAAVLRDGAAPVPRPARPVLGEWDRRARVVLRQLPRQPRR